MSFVVTMPLNVVEDEEEDAGRSTTVTMDTSSMVGTPRTEVWTYRYEDGMAQIIRMM